jgi:hypothetical protein
MEEVALLPLFFRFLFWACFLVLLLYKNRKKRHSIVEPHLNFDWHQFSFSFSVKHINNVSIRN